MTEEKKIRPFSNGFEWRSWTTKNCDRCLKYENKSTTIEDAGCRLAFSIDLGRVTDGMISENIASEFGCKLDDKLHFTDCKKIKLKNGIS